MPVEDELYDDESVDCEHGEILDEQECALYLIEGSEHPGTCSHSIHGCCNERQLTCGTIHIGGAYLRQLICYKLVTGWWVHW